MNRQRKLSNFLLKIERSISQLLTNLDFYNFEKMRFIKVQLFLIILYFLNAYFRNKHNIVLINSYFSDLLAGAVILNFFLEIQTKFKVLKGLKFYKYLVLFITIFMGYIWERYSGLLFTNTTRDYFDVLAYSIVPLYYCIKK